MSDRSKDTKVIQLDELVPFSLHPVRTRTDEQLKPLVLDIQENGLKSPIIVRPADSGKYEIICGHNRVKAVELLGGDSILAEVRSGLSDDDAQDLFYGTYLNPKAFWSWDYLQRFKAIQYIVKRIRKDSQQGKRSDLWEKIDCTTTEEQDHKSRRPTTRDKAAKEIGISTATLSRYRSMVKLPDESLERMARLMDERLLTSEEAYQLSRLDFAQVKILLELCEENPDKRIDVEQVKMLGTRKSREGTLRVAVIDKKALRNTLMPRKW